MNVDGLYHQIWYLIVKITAIFAQVSGVVFIGLDAHLQPYMVAG